MLEKINGFIWNAGLLSLLLGTGIFLTVKTGFFQIRRAGYICRSLMKSLRQGGKAQWKVTASALGASMGTGNIVGVSAALAAGGAGAVFWMEVSALFGMMLTYGENVLSMKYRKKESDGTITGGAAAYIRFGLGSPKLAAVYVILCTAAALGMGCMTQSSAAADALSGEFGIPCAVTGIVIAVFLFFNISGGAKSVGNALQYLLPFASLSYMIIAAAVICVNHRNIPSALSEIFTGAWGLKQAGAGVMGSALSAGLRHGIFSNEAGLGSSALIHSNAENNDPYIQGMWSMAEVFADTIVCCTLTALMILTSGVPAGIGTETISQAFGMVLGDSGGAASAVMITLFALCTMLGWCCCGESALRSIVRNRKGIAAYRIVFCICGGLGAAGALSDIWTLSDIANGLMAFPNLLALLLLSRDITIPTGNNMKNKRDVYKMLKGTKNS